MAIILSNIGFIIYIFGFFFWIVSFKMKKPKKTKAEIASVVFYLVSVIFWITAHVVK